MRKIISYIFVFRDIFLSRFLLFYNSLRTSCNFNLDGQHKKTTTNFKTKNINLSFVIFLFLGPTGPYCASGPPSSCQAFLSDSVGCTVSKTHTIKRALITLNIIIFLFLFSTRHLVLNVTCQEGSVLVNNCKNIHKGYSVMF